MPALPDETTSWDVADLGLSGGPPVTVSDPPPAEGGDAAPPKFGRIGRYALKYKLGEGGIGTVYAAHDPLLSRPIAVKTLHLEIPAGERESFNALFLNEARAAAGLSHPNIVTVFDAGISDNRAYIAMELLKGRDLRQMRQDGWRATPPQAALIVRRVADALAYAHSKGVVHRDVKPANIFMIGRTQPKVLDFGIARIAHPRDAHGHESQDHIAAGSPYYMAPEQARHERVDRRADVFSLGVVLYELLTQHKPFRGSTFDEIITAVLEHEPPLAHVVDPAVPEALARIAAKAIEKNPELRHRSARAFARELRHWLEHNTLTTDGEMQVSRRGGWPLWAGIGGLGAVLVGAIAWAGLVPRGAIHRVPSVEPVPAHAVVREAAPEATAAASFASAAAAPAEVMPPETVTTRSPPPAEEPSSSTVAIAAVVSDLPPAAASAAPHSIAHRLPVPDKHAREAKVAVSAPPPTPTGQVHLAISPWGEVEVDGRVAGTSPPLTELVLPTGRHQVLVRNTDLAPFDLTVDVTAERPVTFKHKF